jgi:DNA-binding MarR family transcriptional regulator
MSDTPLALEQLIWQVRRAFWDFAAMADRALSGLGVRAGERALIERIAAAGRPVSLSRLARDANVSRQHVQQTLRRLDPAWLELGKDAADAKVVTVRLSDAGQALWSQIRARDEAVLADLAEGLDAGELAVATVLLERLRAKAASLEIRS